MFSISGKEPLVCEPVALPGDARGAEVFLDMSGLEFVCPLDLVAIASWSQGLSTRGVVILPTGDIGSYLERMDLLVHLRRQGWQVQRVEQGPRENLPHRLLEVTPLADAWDVEQLANQLPALFAIGRADPRRSRALHFAFGELCDNATSHSDGTPVYVAAQRYTGATSGDKARIELAVADHGIGITEHLRRNPRHRQIDNDVEGLALALRPGVSGTADDRGYGFFDVLRAIQDVGKGEVTIYSGQAMARLPLGFGPERRVFTELGGSVRGTRVQVRVYED